ncbi:TPA: MarR family transcriptional regulator [Bacillus pseudomycoides]|nr:MarR family transcriptional regulator [Bacillus pseudomycoides]
MINDENLSLKLFVILSRAAQSITKRIEEDIKSYGLNPTEFVVLELLYNKGDQPIQKIGDKILLASSSITYASITPEGIELMDTIFPKHKQAIRQIFGGLDSGEKKVMIEQLKKLGYYAQEL